MSPTIAPRLTTIAEELLLMMLDGTGSLPDMPFGALGVALAGATLMQLALDGRVDTDSQALVLVSDRRTGDPLQDEALAQIALTSELHPTAWWLELLAQRREEFLGLLAAGLARRDILHVVNERVLWGGGKRLYPTEADPGQATRARLLALLFSEELPDPRDAMLICLAEVTGLLPRILSAEDLQRARPRIETLKVLEEISRSVTGVAAEVLTAIATTLPMV
jgi:hypothetical protein